MDSLFLRRSLGLNAAVLIGSLAGPFIADGVGLATALLVFAAGRVVTALALLKWG